MIDILMVVVAIVCIYAAISLIVYITLHIAAVVYEVRARRNDPGYRRSRHMSALSFTAFQVYGFIGALWLPVLIYAIRERLRRA